MNWTEALKLHAMFLADEPGGQRFSVDIYGQNLKGADLRDADLRAANLRDADLRAANLRDADLRDAYLGGADLTDANLFNCIGNMRQIKSAQFEKWGLTWTHDTLQIGCQNHSIEDWKNFTDEQISKMDSGALKWWKKYKEIIFALLEASPADK